MALLAVRAAMLPQDALKQLRFKDLETWLAELESLRAEIVVLRDDLHAALTAEIGTLSPSQERNRLIQLRRDIYQDRYNAKRVPSGYPYAANLQNLCANHDRLTGLMGKLDSALVSEARVALRNLLASPLVCAAVRSACPHLPDESTHADAAFTRRDRTLYGYITKMTAKATPLGLFGAIGRPSSIGPIYVKASISQTWLAELEAALLSVPKRRMRAKVWIVLSYEDDQGYVFLGTKARNLGICRVRKSRPLTALVEMLAESPAGMTLQDCVHGMASSTLGISEEQALLFVEKLIAKDICRLSLRHSSPPYLEGTEELPESVRRIVQRLEKAEDEPISLEEALRLTATASSLAKDGTLAKEGTPTPFFLEVSEADLHKGSTRDGGRVEMKLKSLKPLFQLLGDFDCTAYCSQQILRGILGTTSLPYLELLDRVREQAPTLLPEAMNAWSRNRESERLAWQASCRAMSGERTLGELLARMEWAPVSRRRNEGVCFLGAPTHDAREFVINNIFTNTGRFGSAETDDSDGINSANRVVNLIPDISLDKTRTRARHGAMGFSFDSSYRADFDQWLDPADIVASVGSDGEVVYHDQRGQFLHFRYSGLLLAANLPLHYQLLLLSHNDVLHNPFTMCNGSGEVPVGEKVFYQEGLTSDGICLRRDYWYVHTSLLAPLAQVGIFKAVCGYRSLLQETTGTNTTQWFFEADTTHKNAHKPTYLDLDSALSVDYARSRLSSIKSDGYIRFSESYPNEDNVWNHSGQKRTTEWLITV